jgi:hypothetical protein
MKGLESWEQDRDKRLHHIVHNMLYGVATSEAAGLLTRHELYGCIYANAKENKGKTRIKPVMFDTEEGNIITSEIGKNNLFLDKEFSKKFAKAVGYNGGEMMFDVIVGNPPYQLQGGSGGTNDSPIYQEFVTKAINIEPVYITMIIKAQWFIGGRRHLLEPFRRIMLNEGHIKVMVDFPDSSIVFPNNEIKGGVCYFLWDKTHQGPCNFYSEMPLGRFGPEKRNIGEFDILVRDKRNVPLIKKVLAKKENSIAPRISGDTPFGIPTNYTTNGSADYKEKETAKYSLLLYANGEKDGRRNQRIQVYIKDSVITKNKEDVNKPKVFMPKAGEGQQEYPDRILGLPILPKTPSVCSQTYIYIAFEKQKEAKNFITYYKTKFFRFLVSVHKVGQDALSSVYQFVPGIPLDGSDPSLDFSSIEGLNDTLYARYGISQKEQDYIEEIILPMD